LIETANRKAGEAAILSSAIRHFYFFVDGIFQKRRQAAALQSALRARNNLRFADPPIRRL
jgi:hypothetical protein